MQRLWDEVRRVVVVGGGVSKLISIVHSPILFPFHEELLEQIHSIA